MALICFDSSSTYIYLHLQLIVKTVTFMLTHSCLLWDSSLVVLISLVGIEFNVLTLNSDSVLAAEEACVFLLS